MVDPSIRIETFQGELEALERTAHVAWRDEYGVDSYPNIYRPDYVAHLLECAGDPRLAIAAYRDDEPVGFLLNLPRRMVLDGREIRAVLTCLLVVRKELFRSGVARAMIGEGLERNRELGFDAALFYLETGHRSSKLIAKLGDLGSPIDHVKRMHPLIRVLDLPAVRASENVRWWEVKALEAIGAARPARPTRDEAVREARDEDVPRLTELLGAYRHRVRLARVPSEDEVRRELLAPPIARTLVFERGGRVEGLLAYVTVDHVGRTTVPWAWINHVAWDALAPRERRRLVDAFLWRAGEEGHAGALEWSKRIYPTAALHRARFVPYPRQIDLMAWRFREDLDLSGIRDVAEIQL